MKDDNNIVNMSTVRAGMANPHLGRLLALTDRLCPEGGETTNALDLGAVNELFALFGVTELRAGQGDEALVRNTLFELGRRVAPHLRGGDVVTDAAFAFLRPRLDPTYDSYLAALRQGQTERIASLAKALRIAGGVPLGSPWLAAGPLSQDA